MTRTSTLTGQLARRGFADAKRAAALIDGWLCHYDGQTWQCEHVVDEILASDDPDLALDGVSRLVAADPNVLEELASDPAWSARVVGVLGASAALNQHLARYPADVLELRGNLRRRPAAELRSELLTAIGADPGSSEPVAPQAGTALADALRLAYRRAVLRIAARDLTSPDPRELLPDIAGELADLADAVVEAALALARAEVPGHEQVRLGVVALGKCGAQELNYVSDVDVLYVAEPRPGPDGAPGSLDRALAIGTRLAGALSRICSAHTAAGTIWQVDAALRPEGKAGPLVRTMASHRAYYEKWAKPWEFQAMLKARPMAGDLALAQEFVDLVWPLVWKVGETEHFIADSQAMRRRVISLIPPKEQGREIKLGAGGLRDVEFTVQLLQLVHGRSDERLRQTGTLTGLQSLIDHGYVGRADGAELAVAYRYQRLLEHRIQLFRLRRTHLMPDDEAGLRRLARAVGAADGAELAEGWRACTRRVQRLHQRMFYSPLLEAVAKISSERVRLSSDAAQTWLTALGYGDPRAALRHIEALSQGMTRQAEIQRQLLPAMLGWFAEGPNPDHGLLAFRQVSEALGRTHWYLRALRDEGAMAEWLAHILASSRYAVDLLLRAPQTVQLLSDPAQLKRQGLAELTAGMQQAARRHDSADKAVEAIRGIRRQELLRLAMGDLLGRIDLDELGWGLSDLAGATIDATLEVASRGVDRSPKISVIAMGRWGGDELSYASDADAMFVVEDSADPEATSKAHKIVGRLRAMLAKPGPDPALAIDVDLRPEGKGGPMVRSLASYRKYYERWSSTWEAQALLRARVGAGDREIGSELLASIDKLRYPEGGLKAGQVSEIRKLKARMEAERLPRGTDPSRHVKLGPGGLSDVEWVVQLLQLRHGDDSPGLRSTETLAALEAAHEAGLIAAADAAALAEAWRLASRIRNAIMLVRGRASDSIPTDARELAAVAEVLGYGKSESSTLIEDYRRRTRLARAVTDRLFWES